MNVLDLLGLVAVFGLIGWIGYRSTRKVHSTNSFILADRGLNRLQASVSLAASDIGGSSIVGATAFIYVVGISGALWNLVAAPAFFILGILVTRRLRRMEITTVPEFLGNRYHPRVRLYSAFLHMAGLSTMLSAQFIVSASAINALLGIPEQLAFFLSFGIVLLYTVGGGLLAVVNTDVIQFFIIFIAMLIMLPVSLINVGGWSAMSSALPEGFLDFGAIGFWTPFSWMLLALMIYGTSQNYLQRVFAAKDERTASFAFAFTGWTYIVYGLLVGVIGLCMVLILPDLSDPNLGFALMVKKILPVGLRGIVLGGVFAATMSTADSMLIGASSLFINDIYLPVFRSGEEDGKVLLLSRIVTILVALIGLGMSSLFDNLIDIMYVAGLLYSAVVFCPLIFGALFEWITPLAAELSIFAAFTVGIVSELFLKDIGQGVLSLPSNILAVSSSLIVLCLVSALQGATAKKLTKR